MRASERHASLPLGMNCRQDEEQNLKSEPAGFELLNETKIIIDRGTKICIDSRTGIESRIRIRAYVKESIVDIRAEASIHMYVPYGLQNDWTDFNEIFKKSPNWLCESAVLHSRTGPFACCRQDGYSQILKTFKPMLDNSVTIDVDKTDFRSDLTTTRWEKATKRSHSSPSVVN
ncbi:hypothetical protein EVAR_59993_1 [Eumeta japonica]|uniref:Uncharacterized protein n=1 Tax=Eumeta variegata TaxID=151549 RepID=A0A4C1ZKP4_EUMVA|nr:hypothetical protein EVAR_59993_1 [Eumeta japonica]